MQLGRVQGCASVKEKFQDLLGDVVLPFVAANERTELVERFKDLVQRSYPILDLVKAEGTDVSLVRAELMKPKVRETVPPRTPTESGLSMGSRRGSMSVQGGGSDVKGGEEDKKLTDTAASGSV